MPDVKANLPSLISGVPSPSFWNTDWGGEAEIVGETLRTPTILVVEPVFVVNPISAFADFYDRVRRAAEYRLPRE